MKRFFALFLLSLFLVVGCSTSNHITITPSPTELITASPEPSIMLVIEPDYPLEIHAEVLKEHDYDLVSTTAYEMTVTNHSDEDVYLFYVNGSFGFRFGGIKYVPANETIKFDMGAYSSGGGVVHDPKIESYEYQSIKTGKSYTVNASNLSIENEYARTVSSDFVMNGEYTYFVSPEEGAFGFYPGREEQIEDLGCYCFNRDETLYDFLLGSYYNYDDYTLINIIDKDMPFNDKNLAYIEKAAKLTGMNYVLNNDYDYNDIKDQYSNLATISLYPSKDDKTPYYVNSYFQNPYVITEEMKNDAIAMWLPLEELPKYYEKYEGNIKGVYGPLNEEQQVIIKALFPSDVMLYFNDEEALGAMKPVIYLYNDQDVAVDVKLVKPTTLTYPEINQGWQVELKNNRMFVNDKEVRYLYYEAEIPDVFDLSKGFVIKKEDSISFLEDKLAYMGLNDLEINDFIVFWLPYLMENKYNFISFQNEIYADIFSIECNPKPDSTLRIYMVMQGLEQPIEIIEQELPKGIEREGLTFIEWGGSILK